LLTCCCAAEFRGAEVGCWAIAGTLNVNAMTAALDNNKRWIGITPSPGVNRRGSAPETAASR
jgi:hypothetical protein